MIESALLDATEAAIATYGVSRLSLERVAECAGVSRATIYRRNVTLEALVNGVLARAMDSLRATMWVALTGLEPANVRLRAALEAILSATEQHLAALSGLFAGHRPGLDPFHTPGPDGLTLDIFAAPLERLLADGALDGSLRQVEPKVTATVLLSATVWSYVHLRHSHDWPAERTRDAVLDLTLRGLQPEESAPSPDGARPERGST
ncbi:MAG: TetR family transcriptional regulator [Micromonosporaceae bacterium]|nr:TetR family transcriptional regulator [Micromonosporaceae bacterium]